MKQNFNFYFPCIEDGGLEKNVFALVNSLAEKNILSIFSLSKTILDIIN